MLLYEIAHGEGWVEFHWDDVQGIEFVRWSSSAIGQHHTLRYIQVSLKNGAKFDLHPKHEQDFRDFSVLKKSQKWDPLPPQEEAMS